MLLVLQGIIIVLAIGLVVYIIMIYNGLIGLKHNIRKASSNIDVLLKQRYDEIPKLVKVCEGYMQHEREVLENVTKARSLLDSATTTKDMHDRSNALTAALRSLFAVVENYPALKADMAFRQLQARISEIENQIADRRELYNSSVNLYNIRIEQFPDLMIARMLHSAPADLWHIEPEHRAHVEIGFGT